ncbi:MAG: ABC transporter ATP-binding protein [Thiohalocapsa sp.]|jgi:iron complex transport system ATP-binding protein
MSVLEIRHLTVTVGARDLVRALGCRIEAGELLGLIGPNGAGKSSVVKAIAQLLPYRGDVELDGRPIRQMTGRERATALAYLSQDDRLQWPISVHDLVALGRHPHRGSWWRGAGPTATADRLAIEAALHATDAWGLRTRRVDELSGGERARVRLARVLAVQARALLADEPVAALDPLHQLQVMQLLHEQCRRDGTAVIVVLHDLTLASRFCDRLLLLHEGIPIAIGSIEQVLTAENLLRVYGIRAVIGEHAGQRYIVPWESETGIPAGGSRSGTVHR